MIAKTNTAVLQLSSHNICTQLLSNNFPENQIGRSKFTSRKEMVSNINLKNRWFLPAPLIPLLTSVHNLTSLLRSLPSSFPRQQTSVKDSNYNYQATLVNINSHKHSSWSETYRLFHQMHQINWSSHLHKGHRTTKLRITYNWVTRPLFQRPQRTTIVGIDSSLPLLYVHLILG